MCVRVRVNVGAVCSVLFESTATFYEHGPAADRLFFDGDKLRFAKEALLARGVGGGGV